MKTKDLTSQQSVLKHSQLALDHWGDLWKGNCERNKDKIVTSLKDIVGKYHNKTAVLFAFGPSFKENIRQFKKMDRKDVVVGCVDKAFKFLVEEGIQPDFCLIADGSVSPSWFADVDKEAIKKCKLISNIYAKPDWSDFWAEVSGPQNIYWFVNKDNLDSHKIYGEMVNYYELIEAASNVGNSLVVFSVKIFGCKNVILYGYDYSWDTGTYYGNGNHMKSTLVGTHREVDTVGNIVYTNDNMRFSADWLHKYSYMVKAIYNVDIFNRTGKGILKIRKY